MKLERKDIIENQEFIDKMAIEIMKIYITGQRPHSFAQSISLAKIAYQQSLAMFHVRQKELMKLAEEVRMIKSEEQE